MLTLTSSQRRKNVESLLNTMPKSHIKEIQDEIQEIHTKMKDFTGDNFFPIYTSYFSKIAGKIKNKLSREYREVFDPKDTNIFNTKQHNPYEDPHSHIQREKERIERGWKAVQAKMAYFREALKGYKKLLLPIIESDLKGINADTIKAIEKIPYDSRYIPSVGGYVNAPYKRFDQIIFAKLRFDKGLSSVLDEMCKYEEKNLLLEIIPIIRNVNDITSKIRNLEQRKWISINVQKGDKGWGICMHNSTGHITSGMDSYTHDILEEIKIRYPGI